MYYHGTDNDSAEIIVKTQKMSPSIGEHQWLGEGCYFYCEEEYAFRWILIRYTNNFTNEFTDDYSDIFGTYTIISADINIPSDRIFTMEDINNNLLFAKTKQTLLESMKSSKKYEHYKITDGVVFNFLFTKLNYQDRYDVVKAVFPISHTNAGSRFDFLPEVQMCVKNLDVISRLQKYSTEIVPQRYEQFIIDYRSRKDELKKKNKLQRYKIKRANIQYK